MAMTVGELLANIEIDDDHFNKGVDRAERKLVTAGARMSSVLTKIRGGLGSLVGPLAMVAKWAAVAGGIGLLGLRAIQLTQSLLPLVNLVMLIPGAVLGAAASLGVLKLATDGVGKAISVGLSGDVKKFAKDLEKLPPPARDFARAIVALKPQVDALKMSLSAGLFTGLGQQVRDLAKVALPTLQARLRDVADAMNLGIRNALNKIKTPGFLATMNVALANIATTLHMLAPAAAPLLQVFATLAEAGSGFLPGFALAISNAATAFALMVDNARQTGQLGTMIQTGIDVLKVLGEVAGEVFGIVQAIFTAAPEGGGALGVLTTILGQLSTFLSSQTGQDFLAQLFYGLQQLGEIAGGLVKAAGPGLVALLAGLRDGLLTLGPAVGPVGKALGDLLAAVAPLLPVLGNLLAVILVALADTISSFTAEFTPLIGLFAKAANEVLPQLLPIFTELVTTALPAAARVGKILFDAFAPIVPVIVEIAKAFFEQLAPQLPALQQQIIETLIPAIAQLAKILADGWMQALQELIPYIPDLVRVTINWIKAAIILAQVLTPVLLLLVRLIVIVMRVGVAIFEALMLFRRFGAAIPEMFANAEHWLIDAGQRIIDGLISGIRSGFRRVKDVLGELTSLLPDWKGPAVVDRRILAPSGRMVMRGFTEGLLTEFGRVRGQLGTMTGRLPAYAAAGTSMSAPSVHTGDTHIYIDGRALDDAFVTAVQRNPTVMSRAVENGDRRDLYARTGR